MNNNTNYDITVLARGCFNYIAARLIIFRLIFTIVPSQQSDSDCRGREDNGVRGWLGYLIDGYSMEWRMCIDKIQFTGKQCPEILWHGYYLISISQVSTIISCLLYSDQTRPDRTDREHNFRFQQREPVSSSEDH